MPARIIHGELRLPATFLQGRAMPEVESQLQAAGLLPREAQHLRWRMDLEAPGGYLLSYSVLLPDEDTP